MLVIPFKLGGGIMMKKNEILLIIPAYNEQDSILKTYKSVLKYNKKSKNKVDVIVINDGSTDNTQQILEENDIPNIQLIQNLGIGGAVQTGYKYAKEKGYNYAIQFDGDGQHDVNYVENILEPLRKNQADLIIGSRFISSISSFKSIGTLVLE